MVIVIAGCGGVGAKMAEEKHQNALHQISQSREQYFACNFHFKVILVKVMNNTEPAISVQARNVFKHDHRLSGNALEYAGLNILFQLGRYLCEL